MAKLDVCLDVFFTDLSYPDRIRKVAECGYKAYEFWFPDMRFDGANVLAEAKDFDRIADLNAELGLVTVDFVLNHSAGSILASLVDKRDRQRILDGLGHYAELAGKIGCTRLISASGNVIPGHKKVEAIGNMVETLVAAGKILAKSGITIILEPFNTKVDHPGCFLDDADLAIDILKQVNLPNVKLLYDIYHNQIMSGNVVSFIRKNIDLIGHFHVAGVPGRNEPDYCELDYGFILKEIDKLGYQGYAGLEYWPKVDAAESLKRTLAYLGT